MLDTNDNDTAREKFLTAMRNVANSVTVVTTDGPVGKNGATVSSFCSVSADPPTLLVCLNKSGSTSSSIRDNGHFCINILSQNQAEIAEQFANPEADKDTLFAGQEWNNHPGNAPSLKRTTAFFCSVSNIVEANSHDIIIGAVNSVSMGTHKPLIYLDRTYHKVY